MEATLSGYYWKASNCCGFVLPGVKPIWKNSNNPGKKNSMGIIFVEIINIKIKAVVKLELWLIGFKLGLCFILPSK